MRTEYGAYRDEDVTTTATPTSPSSSSWFTTSLANICAPLLSCVSWKPRRSKSTSLTSISWPLGRESDQDLLIAQDDEKSYPPIDEQPPPMAHPVLLDSALATDDARPSAGDGEKLPRKSFASSRTVMSLKKRFRSDSSTCRPQISAPTNFRHLQSTSFRFPEFEPDQRQQQPPESRPRHRSPATDAAARPGFRPLELNVSLPGNRVSPILPLFDFPSVSPPKPAHLMDRLEEHHELVRQRSSSSMPFHIPRRRPAAGSVSSSAQDGNEDREAAPSIPPKSSARARAYTSPEVEQMKARVAGAMLEVEKLQRQIDDVIERQSLYASSRPSTAHSMARTMTELEPMPDIPALPPSAPSFAERLYDFERPQGSPVKSPFEISNRSQDFGEQQQHTTAASTPTRARREDPPLAPPLPLVLRPPLRKKKSFSRVSTWLFPARSHGHNRNISLDSVTNQPRPIKRTEGFFQCVPGTGADRTSFDSLGSISMYETDEDDDDEQRTGPTTWSPGSSPATKQDELPPLQRVATFGTGSSSSRPFRCSAIMVS